MVGRSNWFVGTVQAYFQERKATFLNHIVWMVPARTAGTHSLLPNPLTGTHSLAAPSTRLVADTFDEPLNSLNSMTEETNVVVAARFARFEGMGGFPVPLPLTGRQLELSR